MRLIGVTAISAVRSTDGSLPGQPSCSGPSCCWPSPPPSPALKPHQRPAEPFAWHHHRCRLMGRPYVGEAARTILRNLSCQRPGRLGHRCPTFIGGLSDQDHVYFIPSSPLFESLSRICVICFLSLGLNPTKKLGS
ncbi:hypothetical protein AMTRI_Chr12g236930 [Amborella trichopoda]